jgi:DNA-binding protein HU-beta/integration host factor subunit beta
LACPDPELVTTKRDIVRAVAEKTALTQAVTSEVVQLALDAIADAVIEEGRLELRNFGVFEVKRRRPRKARDPRTGETMDVPARNVVTFRPGRALETRLASLPPARRR